MTSAGVDPLPPSASALEGEAAATLRNYLSREPYPAGIVAVWRRPGLPASEINVLQVGPDHQRFGIVGFPVNVGSWIHQTAVAVLDRDALRDALARGDELYGISTQAREDATTFLARFPPPRGAGISR